jgi:hypothetical protein
VPHEANLSPVLQGDRGFSFGHPQLRQAQASRAGAKGDDDYDVIGSDGLVIGRIFKATKSPVGTPLMWTLAYGDHEDRTPRGTDMRQHGRPLCRRSLGAGTERRNRTCDAANPRRFRDFSPPFGLRRVWPSIHNWQRHRASFVCRPDRPCPPLWRVLPSHGRASTLDHLDERMA